MKRRDFLRKTLVAASAPIVVPRHVLGRGFTAPSDKILMGCIGVGNMGAGHVRSFLGYDDVQIVAVCDVRKAHRDSVKRFVDNRYNNKECRAYSDFRDLLAQENVDAILNATPDHWHVLIGLEAARRGVDMYYEKPLSRTIAESRAIRDAAKKHGVIFQFGTQQRSDQQFRFAIESVQNGRIGSLEHAMIGSAGYKQIRLQKEQPVPAGFDYDMWVGPAPWAPYTFKRCTREWTLLLDYSLGCVSGAWGIHSVDMVQWLNRSDNGAPISAEGWGDFPKNNFYDTAQHFEVEHIYENGLKLTHMDMVTAKKKAPQFDLFWMAILFQGTDGWIYVGRGFIDAEPKSLLREKLGPNDQRLPWSTDHRRNFLNCVKSRKQPVSHIDSAFYSDVACHQAHIAMKLGRKIYWDNDSENFQNDEQANRMTVRAMRGEWHI